MKRSERERQAKAFLGWHKKRPGTLEDDFAYWVAGKDFELRDELEIRTIVHEIVTSTGPATALLAWPA